jgi:hypothetical protein
MAGRRPLEKGFRRGFGLSVLVAAGTVIAWTYKLLFSGSDERHYQKYRRRFIGDVERSFSYLFSEHGGSIHPDAGKDLRRAFDYVSATLEFKEMRVQIIRGRGELDTRLAPSFDAEEWRDLEFLSQLVGLPEGKFSLFAQDQLDELAGQLQTNWSQLAAVLSEENWFPSLTNAEWRRFLKLSPEEKLAVRASIAPSPRKPTTTRGLIIGPA